MLILAKTHFYCPTVHSQNYYFCTAWCMSEWCMSELAVYAKPVHIAVIMWLCFSNFPLCFKWNCAVHKITDWVMTTSYVIQIVWCVVLLLLHALMVMLYCWWEIHVQSYPCQTSLSESVIPTRFSQHSYQHVYTVCSIDMKMYNCLCVISLSRLCLSIVVT